jgi:hypothetical protein
MEKGMTQLQTNHLEIAAQTWVNEKGREIGGIVVGDALSKAGADIQALDLKSISEAENYARRFLAAWLKNCVIEFVRGYVSDVEEQALQIEKLLRDHLDTSLTSPFVCGQPERDAKLLAEAQTEMLAAIEAVLPYLPDRNDAKDYASTNEGRASSFQVAAIKLREVYDRNK